MNTFPRIAEEARILIVPDPDIDREAEIEDLREGASRWQWACKDAAQQFKRRKAMQMHPEVAKRLQREARRDNRRMRLRANWLLFSVSAVTLGMALMLVLEIVRGR